MRDPLFVIIDMRTGKRVGPTSFLDRESAELALDAARKRWARNRDVLERLDWYFVDEWMEVHE